MKPTTLITGAGKRIGAAIALHLAAQGHDLVLHYRSAQGASQALAETLRGHYGTNITLVQADLEYLPEGGAFWAGLPPVSAIIHNAARFVREPFAQMTAASLRAQLAVNFEAPLLLTQGFLAQLPQGVHGQVIVLGDGAKKWSISPEFFSYAVSKCAWEGVIDLLGVGLRTTCLCECDRIGANLAWCARQRRDACAGCGACPT